MKKFVEGVVEKVEEEGKESIFEAVVQKVGRERLEKAGVYLRLQEEIGRAAKEGKTVEPLLVEMDWFEMRQIKEEDAEKEGEQMEEERIDAEVSGSIDLDEEIDNKITLEMVEEEVLKVDQEILPEKADVPAENNEQKDHDDDNQTGDSKGKIEY